MTQTQILDIDRVDALINEGLTCAIFDIDGTISESNIGNLYFYMKRREYGFMRWLLWFVLFILFRYPYFILLDRRNRAQAQQAIYGLYAGYRSDQIEAMAKELFARKLLPKIYPQVEELIRHLQDRGTPIILLSSNIEPIAQAYAAHFRTDACHAVPLDKICGAVAPAEYFLAFKEAKLAEISGAERALVVADSVSDLPILRKSENPVIVTKKQKPWMLDLPNASFIYI